MPKYYGCPCEGCGKPLTLQDDIVVCPDCGAPYHRVCYEKLGRCIHSPAHASGYEWKFPYQDADLRTCPACGERTLRGESVCRCCGRWWAPTFSWRAIRRCWCRCSYCISVCRK